MTTNEMILNTLKTRTTREPKYKSILEDMGFVVTDEKLVENHWRVYNPETGRYLVFWKDGDNRLALYGNHSHHTGDYSKMDLVGFLKCDRKHDIDFNLGWSKYKRARFALKDYKEMREYKERDVEEKRQRVEKAMEQLQKELEILNHYNEKIEEIRNDMKEWRKTAG